MITKQKSKEMEMISENIKDTEGRQRDTDMKQEVQKEQMEEKQYERTNNRNLT